MDIILYDGFLFLFLWNQRVNSMLFKIYDHIFLPAPHIALLVKNSTLIDSLKFYRKLLPADVLSIYI